MTVVLEHGEVRLSNAEFELSRPRSLVMTLTDWSGYAVDTMEWQIQEAIAHFSETVERTLKEGLRRP